MQHQRHHDDHHNHHAEKDKNAAEEHELWKDAEAAVSSIDRAQDEMRRQMQLDQPWGKWFVERARHIWSEFNVGVAKVGRTHHDCSKGDSCNHTRVRLRVYVYKPFTQRSVLGAHVCLTRLESPDPENMPFGGCPRIMCFEQQTYAHDERALFLEFDDLYFCSITGRDHLCGVHCKNGVSHGVESQYKFVCSMTHNVLDKELAPELVHSSMWKGHNEVLQQMDMSGDGPSNAVGATSMRNFNPSENSAKNAGGFHKWTTDMLSVKTWLELEGFSKPLQTGNTKKSNTAATATKRATSDSVSFVSKLSEGEGMATTTEERVMRYIMTRVYVLFVNERRKKLAQIVSGQIFQTRVRMRRMSVWRQQPMVLSRLRLQFDSDSVYFQYPLDWILAQRAMMTFNGICILTPLDTINTVLQLAHQIIILYRTIILYTNTGRQHPVCFPLQSFVFAALSLIAEGLTLPGGVVVIPRDDRATLYFCGTFAQQTIPHEIFRNDYVQIVRYNIVSAITRAVQMESMDSNIYSVGLQESTDPSMVDLKPVIAKLPQIYFKNKPQRVGKTTTTTTTPTKTRTV